MINDSTAKTFTKKISSLNQQFQKLKIGKEQLLKIINEAEVSEQVYNSNAIENSTLTLEETDKILMKIDLDRCINERELFEAKNLARVVEYIDTKAPEKELDLELILLLHKMLISNINDGIAGRFRINEWVRIGQYVAVPPDEVIDRLQNLVAEYNSSNEEIAVKIAKFHLGFEYIHPFVDGNGRIGRVLNNYLLIRNNLPPIILSYSSRPDYYKAFREYQLESKSTTMIQLVSLAMINSLSKRIAYLESKNIMKLSQFAVENKKPMQNLINKANRGSIPAFRDKGVWMIGSEYKLEKVILPKK